MQAVREAMIDVRCCHGRPLHLGVTLVTDGWLLLAMASHKTTVIQT